MATGRVPTTANSPLTTKGDLFTYDTSQARLVVGSNGETLVADSSATTGLRWSGGYSLVNPILNGGQDLWQRGTSISLAASTSYANGFISDRWQMQTNANQAHTVSRQATGDTTNLPNIQYCARIQRNSGQTGTGAVTLTQSVETTNSIPFAGKTVTLSFYARKGADFSPTSSTLTAYLFSGTGTDQNINAAPTGQATVMTAGSTLTTAWQRFTLSGTVSASATQIFVYYTWTPTGTASTNDYFEITGVQIDVGSVALPFRRSGGTLAGELAACQRYFWKQTGGHNTVYGLGQGQNTENVYAQVNLPVNMRTKTMVLGYSNLRLSDFVAAITPTAIAIYTTTGGAGSVATNNLVQLHCSGLPGNAVAHRPYTLQNADNTAGYLQFDAEL